MLTIDTLINDLARGCKPKQQWRIGVELERFAVNKATGAALPYEGTPSISALLIRFAEENGWEIITEGGNPIALKDDGTTLSLEPGGQVEYSGPPLASLAEVKSSMDDFDAKLEAAAAHLGISFLYKGFHPHWRREDISWMPKGRYRLMREYMPTRGQHGLDMMLRTAGAQINLDFASEADMVQKFRIALALQPVTTALLANSAYVEGKDTGFQSYRSYAWTETDPDRCGVPSFVFDDDMSFARYVEYALDVPMYFIQRDGKYVDMTGRSFRQFMAGTLPGFEGQCATLEDWHDHLTTIFPDVRLKTYLELRDHDSVPPPLVYAMAAFWAGLFYNDTALEKAAELIEGWDAAAITAMRLAVPRNGLMAQTPAGESVKELAVKILEITRSGLAPDEQVLLAPFEDKLGL